MNTSQNSIHAVSTLLFWMFCISNFFMAIRCLLLLRNIHVLVSWLTGPLDQYGILIHIRFIQLVL
jgi:hypothetical protein